MPQAYRDRIRTIGRHTDDDTNYAKQTRGLFTRTVCKIGAMTFMQYTSFINYRPIGQIKYALI